MKKIVTTINLNEFNVNKQECCLWSGQQNITKTSDKIILNDSAFNYNYIKVIIKATDGNNVFSSTNIFTVESLNVRYEIGYCRTNLSVGTALIFEDNITIGLAGSPVVGAVISRANIIKITGIK